MIFQGGNYMNSFKVKKVKPGAVIPKKAHTSDAGFDLYACLTVPIIISPGKCEKIPTGISIALPDNTFGAIFARSGLATKQGLRPANAVGVADSGYRGEYIVALYNDSNTIQVINNGDRIAQLVVMPFVQCEFVEVDELDETSRGAGGFGSTGAN